LFLFHARPKKLSITLHELPNGFYIGVCYPRPRKINNNKKTNSSVRCKKGKFHKTTNQLQFLHLLLRVSTDPCCHEANNHNNLFELDNLYFGHRTNEAKAFNLKSVM